jgi:hypothetical protein
VELLQGVSIRDAGLFLEEKACISCGSHDTDCAFALAEFHGLDGLVGG